MLILQRTVRKKERGKQQQKRGAGGTLTSSQKDWDGDVWVYKIGLKCNGNQVSLSLREIENWNSFFMVCLLWGGGREGGGGLCIHACVLMYISSMH